MTATRRSARERNGPAATRPAARPPACDICGVDDRKFDVHAVNRKELRASVAGWIKFVCQKCEARFAPRPGDES